MRIKQDLNIGRNIRDLRLQRGMTQEQVVAKLQLAGCDISRSVYSQIEIGTYNVKVSELKALRTIFGVDYNAFFAGV